MTKKIKDNSNSLPEKVTPKHTEKFRVLTPSEFAKEKLEAIRRAGRKIGRRAYVKKDSLQDVIIREEKEIGEFELSKLGKQVGDYYKKMQKDMEFNVDKYLEYRKKKLSK